MSTLELKFSIQNILDRIDDKKILEAVHTLLQTTLKRQDEDFWDTLSDEEKASIEKGLEDVKAGRVHKHEDVMKMVKKKYKF
jgi:predicted transcriptional regulator